MNGEKTAAFMQSLFGLMGKKVCIRYADESVTEGTLKGVFLDGAEIETDGKSEKVLYTEMEAVSALPAKGMEEVAPVAPLLADVSAESLLADIIEGRREALLRKLLDADFCEKEGLTAEEGAAIRVKVGMPNIPWGSETSSVVTRYRMILQVKADPEVLERLFIKVIHTEEKKKSFALLELLRLYVKQERYEKVIDLYEAHASFLGREAHDHMMAYGTAVGYIKGASALRAFLDDNPALRSNDNRKNYFRKLLEHLEETPEAEEKEEAPKEAVMDKASAFARAISEGNEEAYLQLYTYLCDTKDSDAPILAAFMLYHSRMWKSMESIEAFESRLDGQYEMPVLTILVNTFKETLASPDPEEAIRFLEKWSLCTGREATRALKSLSRSGQEKNSAEVIVLMAAAWRQPDAWRQLLRIYKNSEPQCEGNIRYGIAYTGKVIQDLYAVQKFARANQLPILDTCATVLRMEWEPTNPLTVHNACKSMQTLSKVMKGVPPLLMHALLCRVCKVAEENPELRAEVLFAGQALALENGFAEMFLTECMPQLSVQPKSLVSLMLELYMHHPEETELGARVKGILERSEAFSGKNLALELAERPEQLLARGIEKRTAVQLLTVITGLNVRKMHDLIFDAILDVEKDGVALSVEAMRRILAAFPEDGLLHEAMYYLLAAKGEKEDAAEMYAALYRYLSLTRSAPNLFVHYVKRLMSGCLYLRRSNMDFPADVPQTPEQVEYFFNRSNQEENYREELDEFWHRIKLMESEDAWYDTLLYAGMSGNWHAFMEIDKTVEGRVFSEIDSYIHDVGRNNFLRSLAGRIVADQPWQHLQGFLSGAERIQLDAIATEAYGEADKRTALRLMRCTTLDKTSSEVLADKLFSVISPETFGVLMPCLRLLMLDSVMVDTLKEQDDAYLEEASRTVMEQKDTVPMQIYNKTYRDFLRALVNLLFDRGLYREASPVYGLLFTTDEEAARHNPENRYTNMTHAVLRQRQKFCDLVCRDPETVDAFRTTTEYAKLINIFAVHFASNRVLDIGKIAPLMTVIQKKLCAAVCFVAKENFGEFERLASEIWKENHSMGEILFTYGEWRIREERWKERCRRYLPQEQDEENRPFFINPKAHLACAKLPILEILELGEHPKDGREAHTAPIQVPKEALKIRRALRAEEFLEMSIGGYALSNAGETETLAYCREALAQYEKAPSLQTGAMVLRAKDFANASEALLRFFCGSFSLCIYAEAKDRGGENLLEFVPDVFTCLAATTAISPGDTEVFCDVLESIFLQITSIEEYSRYFAKHAAHLRTLLLSAKGMDEEMQNAMLLYLGAAQSLMEMDPEGDGEQKLSVIRRQKQALTQHIQKYGSKTAGLLVKALDILISEVEEPLREQPLLTIRVDTNAIKSGNLLTGYVENEGHAIAEDAVLKITYANGESREVQMRQLFGDYKAPFAFPLLGEEGDKASATLLLTYIYEGEERRLWKALQDIAILPREEYALNLLPGIAIPAEEVEKYFVGRAEEIQSFENEFFRLETDADGKVFRTVRPPREVPVMVMNGPKRVGKSSLLHRVEKIVQEIPDAWVAVHFDAQDAKSMREVFVKAFSLNWKIDKKPIAEHPAYAAIEAMLPKEDSALSILELGRYYEALRDTFAPGKKIFYLIDEIETVMELAGPEVLLNMLQYAMKNLNHVISFLICGSDDLTNYMFEMENKTQFFQLAKTCAVGKMPKHEYRQLLEGFAKRTGIQPDEAAKEALWLLTRGQIYYTHLIFNQLVDLYRSRPILRTRCDMRLFDVYYAFDRLHGGSEMFSGLSTMFDSYGSGEKEVIETVAAYSMTPGEGITLERLQKRSGVENVEKAVTRLEARGFLTFAGGRYMLSSEMYRIAFGKYATATLYFRN